MADQLQGVPAPLPPVPSAAPQALQVPQQPAALQAPQQPAVLQTPQQPAAPQAPQQMVH